MNKCIIFGLSCFSDLVANYIEAENQYEIIAYTVNEKEDIERLIEEGIDGIITDYPNIALEILKK